MEKTELQLALEKLAEVNKEFNEKAKYAFPKILSASRTIKLLTGAVGSMEKHGGGWHHRGWVPNMNALKRPPPALTALMFKKK